MNEDFLSKTSRNRFNFNDGHKPRAYANSILIIYYFEANSILSQFTLNYKNLYH